MSSIDPKTALIQARQHVVDCEASTEPLAPLKLAAALEAYADLLEACGNKAECLDNRQQARSIRRDYYQAQLANDKTPDWQIQMQLHEGRKAGSVAEKNCNANVDKLLGVPQPEHEIPGASIANNGTLGSYQTTLQRRTRGSGAIGIAILSFLIAGESVFGLPKSAHVVAIPMCVVGVLFVLIYLYKRNSDS